MLVKAMGEVREEETENVRKEALKTLRMGLSYFRARGFTPFEIARKLADGLTLAQMWGTAATLLALDDAATADEMCRLAERAEREAEEAEAARRKRDRVDTYYICDTDGAVLAIAENKTYAYANSLRVDMMGRFGWLDVLTGEEYDEQYGEEAT